jgi:hypothetical protein
VHGRVTANHSFGAAIDANGLCALRPTDTLEALRHRAEAALANDGVGHARLGYDVLVKLTMDELIEQEFVRPEEGQ